MGTFVLFAETALLQRSTSTSSEILSLFFCHGCIYRVAIFAQMPLHLIHTCIVCRSLIHLLTAITKQMSFAIGWIDRK